MTKISDISVMLFPWDAKKPSVNKIIDAAKLAEDIGFYSVTLPTHMTMPPSWFFRDFHNFRLRVVLILDYRGIDLYLTVVFDVYNRYKVRQTDSKNVRNMLRHVMGGPGLYLKFSEFSLFEKCQNGQEFRA